jgi:hypothetical protein
MDRIENGKVRETHRPQGDLRSLVTKIRRNTQTDGEAQKNTHTDIKVIS